MIAEPHGARSETDKFPQSSQFALSDSRHLNRSQPVYTDFMWLRTDGYGITDDMLERLRAIAPEGLSVRRDSSTWLNIDTGARVLHIRFGDGGGLGENHGVYYQAPSGELSNITYPVSRMMDYERKLSPESAEHAARYGDDVDRIRKVNLYVVSKTEFDIEKILGLRSGEFDGVWPEKDGIKF